MKRTIFAIIMMLTSMTNVLAQKPYEYDIWDVLVGGKVGVGASTLTKLDADFKFFPYASINAEMYLNKKMSISLEVAYAHKGASEAKSMSPSDLNPRYNYDFHYINTSYLFKYFPVKNLGVYTGLTLGRLVSARAKAGDKSWDIFKNLHTGDFNFPIGLEYTIGQNLTIDGRFHWSPRWIAQSSTAKEALGKSRNELISLTVGYKVQVF